MHNIRRRKHLLLSVLAPAVILLLLAVFCLRPEISLCTDTVSQEAFGNYEENYTVLDVLGVSYEGYRIAGDEADGGLFCLTTPEQTLSCELLEGSFGNITPISGIRKITVLYKSDCDVTVSCGNDRNALSEVCVLPAREEYGEQTIKLTERSSYFRLSGGLGKAHVAALDIYGGRATADETAEHEVKGIRYLPETDYDPREGETLEIPVVRTEPDGSYSVAEWKSYTYHSFSYCRDKIENEGESPEAYALTDPVDVANYFILFNRIPANYGTKEEDSELWAAIGIQENVPTGEEVLAVFGDDLARYVRQFNRTDGYVTAIDYVDYEGTGGPVYYEFDFDTNGSYDFAHRGVGRVVGWAKGFSCYGDGINTATVTTDHYFTFSEYTNCGFFNPCFDGTSESKTGLSFARSEELTMDELTLAKAG